MTFKDLSSVSNNSDWTNNYENTPATPSNALQLQSVATVIHSHGHKDLKMKNEEAITPLHLLKEVLENKGELTNLDAHWIDSNTLAIDGISNLTLHSYMLEAEKKGKKVELIKTTTIKISN